MASSINDKELPVKNDSLMKGNNECGKEREPGKDEVNEVDDKLIGDDRIAMKVIYKNETATEDAGSAGNSNY